MNGYHFPVEFMCQKRTDVVFIVILFDVEIISTR